MRCIFAPVLRVQGFKSLFAFAGGQGTFACESHICRLTCAVAVNHLSELQGVLGGWLELACGASEEQCTSG